MNPLIKAWFAFVLSWGMLCQTTLGLWGERDDAGRDGVRRCCGVNCHRCPPKSQGPGCCDRGHAPVPAPGLPNPSNNDWLMAALTPALPSAAITVLSRAERGVFPPVHPADVPFYQRNCAYLI